MLFSNGIIVCNGSASGLEERRPELRRYARKLQKLGFPVRLREVQILIASACHSPSAGLDLKAVAEERTTMQDPELFPALDF